MPKAPPSRLSAGLAAGPALAAPACTVHVQAFRSLLHDEAACLAAAADIGAFVLSDTCVRWDIAHQRVEITIYYRAAGGGVAPPPHLPIIAKLIGWLAKDQGLCPHEVTMLPLVA